LIYVDVQGAELEVFNGGTRTIQKAKYIFSEVTHGGLYVNDTSFLTLAQFLDSYSFKLAWSRIDPQTGSGDGLFVKK
jgi:hypothetical protein